MHLAERIYSDAEDYYTQSDKDNLQQQEKRDYDIIASEYRSLFESEKGERVLKRLINSFLTRPIARPNDDLIQVGIREGRADVVRQILQQIEYAKSKGL